MLSVSELTVQFGEHPLFENVNLRLTAGNCYGFIGANGAGKSTFLRVITGEIDPNAGTVALDPGCRMAWLRQDRNAYNDEKVLDTVLMGHAEAWGLMQRMDELYAKEDFSSADGEQVAKLQERFDELGGYQLESDAAEVLTNLGVRPAYHDKALGDLDDDAVLLLQRRVPAEVVEFSGARGCVRSRNRGGVRLDDTDGDVRGCPRAD